MGRLHCYDDDRGSGGLSSMTGTVMGVRREGERLRLLEEHHA
jgi:hypothetical protein